MNPSSRRKFITTTLGAAAGALAGATIASGAGGAPAPGPRRMTIDLACGSIGVRANLREALDLAVRHGFESFDPPADELAALSPSDLEKLQAEMRAKKIVFGAVGLPLEFRRDDEGFEATLAKLPAFAAAMARAGVSRVGTWISPGSDSLTYTRNFRRHADRLRRAAEVLGENGLRLGLEYVAPRTSWSRSRFPFIHTMAEMKDLLEAIGRPNVGFVLDSWHWYTAKERGEDILSLKGAAVIAVDLNDAPAGKAVDEQVDNRRDLPAATGVIDVAVFLRALVSIGYGGPVRAEPFREDLGKMPREEAVAAVAAAMKKAFAGTDESPGGFEHKK